MATQVYLAAVEGGGTTFLASIARLVNENEDRSSSCISIGEANLEILLTASFPPNDAKTEWSPRQIISAITQFFVDNRPTSGYAALGIATFGPTGASPHSPSYGSILSGCPKKEWRGIDLLTPLKEACEVEKVGFDTDVNAPALAEFRHRCHLQNITKHIGETRVNEKQLTSLAYITIGTGVGVGLVINSEPVHGILHPEGGHCPIQTLPGDDFMGYSWGKDRSPFGGVATVEGVTSSVALTERLMSLHKEHRGQRDHANVNDASTRNILATLPDEHEIWAHASNAIANLCVTILLLTSCQTIVLGGGIMNRSSLYGRIRSDTLKLLNGYLDVEELSEDGIKHVICGSSWQDIGSGLVGAFALALDSFEKNDARKEREEKKPRSFSSGLLVGVVLSMSLLMLAKVVLRRP